MKIDAPRGAIGITLDRPRTLFFDTTATWKLAEKYGAGFVRQLYTVDTSGGKPTVKLKSPEAMEYFLWAGLQAEISDTGEVLTEETVKGFIHPWTFEPIFNALVMAITGAVSTPIPKSSAAGKTASPPRGRAAGKKASTTTKR